jgi:hypothetical protein
MRYVPAVLAAKCAARVVLVWSKTRADPSRVGCCLMSLHAMIDESGQRASTPASSDHFVLSAVVYRDVNAGLVTALLAELRADLGRQPGQRLHWSGFRTRPQRLYAAYELAQAQYVKIISVVVCKRLIAIALPDEHLSYMFTFRLLLERLSWLAQDHASVLSYTLSHVRRFPLAKLREYEAKLRGLGERTTIRWDHLDPAGGRLDNDTSVEGLQQPNFDIRRRGLSFAQYGCLRVETPVPA